MIKNSLFLNLIFFNLNKILQSLYFLWRLLVILKILYYLKILLILYFFSYISESKFMNIKFNITS